MAIFMMNTHFLFVSPFFIISLFYHEFVQFSNFDKPLIKIILLTVKRCFFETNKCGNIAL